MEDLLAVAGRGEDGVFVATEADKSEMKRRLISAEISTALEQVAVRVHVVDLRRGTRKTVARVDRLSHRLHNRTYAKHAVLDDCTRPQRENKICRPWPRRCSFR